MTKMNSSLDRLGLRTIILLWVSIFVVSKDNTVERISKEKHLEAKRLVNSLNRPSSVKSFQVGNGDIFDCVPISKQIAFGHPSLKNHTNQMRPTSFPSYQKNGNSSYIYSAAIATGFKGRRCPVGSVLVRRIQVKDILRSRRSTSVSNFGTKVVLRKNHNYAVAIQEGGPFYGTEGLLGVWKPKLHHDGQLSIAQFWVSNGPERIEAGWIVFDDGPPEFFVYWTSDDYVSTGCFNLVCPGFVQESKTVRPGARIRPISTYGGMQRGISLTVFKEQVGNWVLLYNGERVGYWPKTLFTRLRFEANRVDWGGEVYSDDQTWPQMGSGHFPSEGNRKACFIWNTRVQYENVIEAFRPNIFPITSPKLYTMVAVKEDKNGKLLSFGGPGTP